MAPLKSIFSTPSKAVDPTLNALFASSIGPVEARAKPKYEGLITAKQRATPAPKPVEPLTKEEEEEAAEDSDEDEEEDDDDDDEDIEEEEEEESAEEEVPPAQTDVKKRKRKNRSEDDDLEGRYFDKLAREAESPAEKRAKRDRAAASDADAGMVEANEDDGDDAGQTIVHESLLKNDSGEGDAADVAENGLDAEQIKEKASRTVFLSNVSIKAINDKAAKKTLLAHLASFIEEKPKEDKEKEAKEKAPAVESLRFRSVPFASAALPKRAAYITGGVMSATTQSVNAYVVYSTPAAARLAVRKLNGTVVLDRHLRADSVAHPSPVDHRRCVFVGNLGFVDDETILNANNEEGEESRKKRHKTPMDVEEGLWRTFGKHAGKVESVRVIRDQVTRVGKGFAYVQFYDGNSVEAALLLADKKFPPLLPRALRVSRCKAPHKTARAVERIQIKGDGKAEGGRDHKSNNRRISREHHGGNKNGGTTGYTPKLTAEQQTSAGRAAKLLGKSAAHGGEKTQTVVFEGMRARAGSSNLFKKNKNNKKGNKGPPGKDASNNQQRRASRAANWKGKKPSGGAA